MRICCTWGIFRCVQDANCKLAHIPIGISVNVERWHHMSNSHIYNFRPYGMLIHLNSVHIRIMPSVCLIVLTASIVTYGCPSFEWFWQSVDSSNVCSIHPYTQISLYCVECLCVHFVQVLYDAVSVKGLPFFCSPLMCARKHHLLL